MFEVTEELAAFWWKPPPKRRSSRPTWPTTCTKPCQKSI